MFTLSPKQFDTFSTVLFDEPLFSYSGSGIDLRRYQIKPARTMAEKAISGAGGTVAGMFPRQSGKNEIQAQTELYLLSVYAQEGGGIVKISPTEKPQNVNAVRRLRDRSRSSLLVDLLKSDGANAWNLGNARITFLSGAPESRIMGATASIMLEVDEAQDVQPAKYDREVAPMAASVNAVRVFWGTAWDDQTLLAREMAAAVKEQTAADQRAFRITADTVIRENPPYAGFVHNMIERLGRDHPHVRTQLYCENIGDLSGMFSEERIAAMRGEHPELREPESGLHEYIFAIDVAGSDETSLKLESAGASEKRDFTALTVCELVRFRSSQYTPEEEKYLKEMDPQYDEWKERHLDQLFRCENLDAILPARFLKYSELTRRPAPDAPLRLPEYRAVMRRTWRNYPISDQVEQLSSLMHQWHPRSVIVDATGAGAGLVSGLMAADREGLVVPVSFTAERKSKMGWDFLGMVDSGRWKEYKPLPAEKPLDPSPAASRQLEGCGQVLQSTFYEQLRACRMTIVSREAQLARWGVPDGTRDPVDGHLIHDDLAVSAALASFYGNI